VNWVQCTLSELGYVGRGRSKHRPRNDPKLYGGEVPFIQTADVQAAHMRIVGYTRTYSVEGLAQSKLWDKPTLCMTIAGENTGSTAILDFPACFPDSIVGFIPDPDKADIRYVKHALDMMRQQFRSVSKGATQDNLSIAKILSFPLRVPALSVQKKIASIIASYDDLIENNRRRIALLEEAARMLYREWFVRFRFPGHEHAKIVDGVPEGWEHISPNDFVADHIGGGWGKDSPEGRETEPAYVIRGTDIPELESGNIDEVGLRFHGPAQLKSRKLVPYNIIFEVSGGGADQPVARTFILTTERLKQWDRDVICASFCKKFAFNSQEDAVFFYFHIREYRDRGEILAYQKESASSLKNFNFEAFMNSYRMVVPSASLRRLFFENASDVLRQQALLSAQIAKLSKARDLLLPRLMSGEIAV
jgi:type I restriction enzyme S subunit